MSKSVQVSRPTPGSDLVIVHIPRDLRLVEIPAEHRSYAAELVERLGIVLACKELGLSRSAVLGLIVRGSGMPGTSAILREGFARRGRTA